MSLSTFACVLLALRNLLNPSKNTKIACHIPVMSDWMNIILRDLLLLNIYWTILLKS